MKIFCLWQTEMSQPLSGLAQTQPAMLMDKYDPGMKRCVGMWESLGSFILWFIIIAIVTWLVIFSLKPGWALKPGTNEVDTGKVLLASIIISLIIVIIFWLIKSSLMSCYKGMY